MVCVCVFFWLWGGEVRGVLQGFKIWEVHVQCRARSPLQCSRCRIVVPGHLSHLARMTVASLQVFAMLWASLAGMLSSVKFSEDANETELSQVSEGGGLYSFGSTVAIYNPRFQRLVQMQL